MVKLELFDFDIKNKTFSFLTLETDTIRGSFLKISKGVNYIFIQFLWDFETTIEFNKKRKE